MVSARKRSVQARDVRPRRLQRRDAPLPSAIALPVGREQEVFFPEGLLGLPSFRRFVLSRYRPADGSDSPFFLLQGKEEEISLPLIEPQRLVPDYHLALPVEVLTRLEAESPADLAVLTIVTLRERLEEITVNLQGPLLLNLASRLGLQLVVEHYPVRSPLLTPRTGQGPVPPKN
ncbi:MAG: flagellar assembly protein FliW [Deltaproteobacteria bacterium]|nr:flagellar assembly protein FliW [Deltaproteobacteria bacterium]